MIYATQKMKPIIIINADDFGLTKTCTLASIEAFKRGIVSNVTMCANSPFFDETINMIFENGMQDSVGIHFNLTEGKPLTNDIANDALFCDNGIFHGKINRKARLPRKSRLNAMNELSKQYEKMICFGIKVTHADSHHHIHTAPSLFGVFVKVTKKYNIKRIRITRNIGKIPAIKKFLKNISNILISFLGYHSVSQFGAIIDLENGIETKRSLEVMVHPDYNMDNELVDRTGFDEYKNPIGDRLEKDGALLAKFRLCSYNEV